MGSTASSVSDVSNWDQSNWTPEDGVFQQMLPRLHQLNADARKEHRDPKNAIRDALIAHTAININATLISDDFATEATRFRVRGPSHFDIRLALTMTLGW